MKRRIYRLKWVKRTKEWVLTEDGAGIVLLIFLTKAEAEQHSRPWAAEHSPSQLLIYTKRGTIGKGGRYEASYGCDSKRRKG